MDDGIKKWFLLQDGQVRGPFAQGEIDVECANHPKSLVWGRGLVEWLDFPEWKRHLLIAGPSLSEKTPAEERHWQVRLGEDIRGPFTYAELLEDLRKVTDYSLVELATDPHSGWREIYAFQKIVDELGITRRAHPRVPIMGTLTINTPKGPVPTKVVSISQGGLGINEAPPFAIGDRFKGTLSSSNLYSELHCTLEVVYIGGDGYTGLRFVQIPTEAHASVIEYVNKFKSP